MDQTFGQACADVLTDLAMNGGGTYEAKTLIPFTPCHGWAVGQAGIHLPARDVTVATIAWATKAVSSEYETSFVGTWLDGGVVYFDAVHYVVAVDRATSLGIEYGQKAIFDFARQEAVTL